MGVILTFFFYVLFILYVICDVNWFIRFFYYVCILYLLKRRRSIFEECYNYGICLISDLDFMLHMNNARYLRELDFNRVWYWGCTGLFKEARRLKGNILQSGCSIRYRKPITFLQIFRIEVKVIYWDERSMYLEQRIVTTHDNFVRAIALSKQTAIGVTMTAVVEAAMGKAVCSPLPPPELMKWMESNEISSMKLRKELAAEPGNPFAGADVVAGPLTSAGCACTHMASCTCSKKDS